MGTRNLTVVRYRKEYVVAQYGQWDGYPSGQGAEVLRFLQNWDRPKFELALQSVSFLTDPEIEKLNEEIDGMPNWQEKYPALTRDTAAKIRAVRPPEPYQGKGIRYSDEVIKRKAGKSAASGAK